MPAATVNEKRAKFDALPAPAVNSAEVGCIPKGKGRIGKILDWVTQKNVLGEHKNSDTGWDIEIVRRSVRSIVSHYAKDGKIALLEVVPDLIREGIYLETTKKNNELDSHIFATKAIVDGIPYAVGYVVREDVNGRRYYDHSLTKITALGQAGQVPLFVDDNLQRVRAQVSTPTEGTDNESTLNILKKHLGVNI